MEIHRIIDGVDHLIELTKEEIEHIHHEKERDYYLKEIEYAIECINEGQECKIDQDAVLKDDALCNKIIEVYTNELYQEDGSKWVNSIIVCMAIKS